jgi:hypothetical protein
MADKVTATIISKAHKAKYYSIIADCTPDVNHIEQLSLTIRFVDLSKENVDISEHFVQFTPINDSTGEGLSESILNLLNIHNLKLKNCRGQGYDNGANMKGRHSGVQKLIINKNPLAFYMPCGCHSLNLVLCDAAKSSTKSVTLFGVLGRLYNLFSASVKRWQLLVDHLKNFTLKRLSDTRWEAKVSSVKAVRYQIGDMYDALISLSEKEERHDPITSHEAFTLSNQIKDFSFLDSLVVWYDILFQINVVSKSMQKSNFDVCNSVKLIEGCYNFLKDYKVTGFEKAISTASELASELGSELKFKDSKRVRYKK